MGYKLQDLIDVEQFQNLQDKFNEIYSFTLAILDIDGNILTASGWQDICTQFHRKHPQCACECRQSDQYILSHVHEANPCVSYRCPRGLVDCATPIVIDGIHYGNFFTGQFFFEKPDLEFFRAQANKFGFDEAAYLKAVEKVPIWTQEQLNSYLFFIKGLIAVISESGLKKLKEAEARKQIEESEERAHTILSTAMDGFWLVDTRGRILEVNEAYCRMSGYSRDELLQMSIPDLVESKSPEVVACELENFRQCGAARFETRHRRKDGHINHFEACVNHLPSSDGRFFCFLRDVSERKAHEAEIERLNRLYQALSQVNQLITRVSTHEELLTGVCQVLVRYGQLKMAWIAWLDAQTKAVIPAAQDGDSGGFLKQLQIRAETSPQAQDYIGAAIRDSRTVVCNDFLNDAATEPYREAGSRQGFGSSAAFSIRAKGAVCGALIVYAEEPGFFRDKEVLLFEEAAVDVSFAMDHIEREMQRQRAVEALRVSEDQFRLLLNSTAEAIYGIDLEGNCTFCNNSCLRQLGYNREEDLLGKNMHLQIHHKHPDGTPYPIEDCRIFRAFQKGGNAHVMDEVLWRADGSCFPVEYWSYPKQRDGKVLGAVVTFMDITERIHLEDQLRQSQKMEAIGQLAGGVAHDFNNIMAATMMQLSFLQRNISLNPEAIELVHELMVEAKRAASLTAQLLMFSRRSILEIKVVDLNDVVANLFKMLARLIGEQITLRFDRREGLPWVDADARMIEQMVLNLAVNARDAMPKGGLLTIGIEPYHIDTQQAKGKIDVQPGVYVCLSVSDTGCGMDEATLKRIFEPFFTTKEIGKGTGLGLAAVHGIMAQHKGWVDVESEPGKGATFKMYFPASTRGATALTQARPLKVARGHETILLVEDEAKLRQVVAQGLRQLGYQVLEAENGQNAVKLWQQHDHGIDLLFSDMVMPEGMTGSELAEMLKKKKPSLKVIVSSGYNVDMAGHDSKSAGDVVYLQKPYEFELMSKTVRDCLDRA